MARRKFTAEPHAPKYQQVFESLARDLLSGRYQPGQKLPSEAALVQHFGTSRITVGRALRELVERGMVERVAGSGTYVLEVRSAASLSFGLLIPDLGKTEIFEPICRGIATAPQARGHALLWGNTETGDGGAEEQALQMCEQYVGRRVAGVSFAPLEVGTRVAETNLAIIAKLEAARIPIVLLDRCVLPYPDRIAHDLVGIDNRRAGYLATEHLVKSGARRLRMVANPGGAPTVEARIAGFREALTANGMAVGIETICRLDTVHEAAVRQLLTDSGHGLGIVCANDRTAGQLMQVVLSLGYRIPGDVRMVGIDDVEYASLLPVPLTTVHQPCREIGEAAMAAMLERVARPKMYVRDILVECHLVVRQSCGAGDSFRGKRF
jgi:GntR family transcriptional regulator, arabinose operon transcriptional repressor